MTQHTQLNLLSRNYLVGPYNREVLDFHNIRSLLFTVVVVVSGVLEMCNVRVPNVESTGAALVETV